MNGQTYRARREALGFSQKTLAELLGVPRESVSRRETGQQRLTGEAWLALERIEGLAEEERAVKAKERGLAGP